jgi:hypothetical protein
MQTKKWIRVGLAGVIASSALGGMLAAGCGGNDSGGAGGTADAGDSSASTVDAKGSIDSGVVDTGVGDAVVEAEAAAQPVHPVVYLVNAAVDPLSPPLRFCFGLGNPTDGGVVQVQDSIPPFPDTRVSPAFPIAGLFPGFGGSVSTAPKLDAFDLTDLTVSLYAIDATKIAADTAEGGPDGGKEVVCEGLIGTDALGTASAAGGGTLTQGTDYWYVGTAPAGLLPHGSTWVAAVVGCVPGETVDSVPFCGGPPTLPAYSAATGNLSLILWQLDSTTVVLATSSDAGGLPLGAQFANASPSWDYAVTASGGNTTAAGFWTVTPSIPVAGTDGGLDGGEGGLDGSLPDSGSLLDSGSFVDSGILEGGIVDGALLDGALLDGSSLDSGLPDAGSPTTTLSFFPITTTGTFGTLSPVTLNTTAGAIPLNVPNAGFATLIPGPGGVVVVPPPGCTVGAQTNGFFRPLVIPLPDIDSITNGVAIGDGGTVTAPSGGTFVYGKGYVFILLGDPNQASTSGGAFNGKSLHFLAFPTSSP